MTGIDLLALAEVVRLRDDFRAKRQRMNDARPTDTLTATRAEYALYDERHRADNEARRDYQNAALWFFDDLPRAQPQEHPYDPS